MTMHLGNRERYNYERLALIMEGFANGTTSRAEFLDLS